MDVFQLRDTVIGSYADYVRSFVRVKDTALREFVEGHLNGETLWPEPLIQLNPAFEAGGWINDLVEQSLLPRDVPTDLSGVKLGDGVSVHEADVIDDYGSDEQRATARAGDEKEDWQQVSEDDIAGHQHVLCFMDAEGLRFHWPAWMCFTLRHYKTSESISTDSIIYSLCRSAADHNTRIQLSEEQRNAIIKFLETCLDLGDWLDIEQIPDALEAWRGGTESRRKLKRKLEFDDAVVKEYVKLVSEDSFLADPDIICQAANGELRPEQQDQFFQQMMNLRQKATQTVAETIDPPRASPDSADAESNSNSLDLYQWAFLLGGVFLAFVAVSVKAEIRMITAAIAVWCFALAELIRRRKRVALPAYVIVSIGGLAWAVFRLWSDGFSGSRLGLIFGSLMMLAEWRPLSEELDGRPQE